MHVIDRVIHERIIEKKIRLENKRPLPPSFVNRLRKELMIEYTYDSNAIEGSSLTLNETRLVIEEGITIGKKPLSEVQGAKNHPEAIEFIEKMVYGSEDISEEKILHLHEIILKGIEPDAGNYRVSGVIVTGAMFTPPRSNEVPQLTQELIDWLKKNIEEYSPIELAARFHHKFVKIHPFSEGNGRIARLLLNAILMRNGYPFLINITNKDRAKYLTSLQEADLGNLEAFVNFIARSSERILDIYLNALDEPEILTLKQASELSPYSVDYLSLLARRGRIAAFKKGNKWQMTKDELMKYVAEMEAKRNRNKY
ncbi:MAG: Fic family protein [Candidatus Bathyarchaeota archaeon]|nr:Fic family protein [Candidatus Bathyarchaeota archaeon]